MMESLTTTRQLSRAQLRKTTKPLLEKKRRARINASLVQLKALVLESVKKDTARYSKLEKADVLELTVRRLRMLQRQQISSAMTMDPSIVSKYRAGYSECLSEVCRYMAAIDSLDPDVRMRLMEHLASCMQRVGAPALESSTTPAMSQQRVDPHPISTACVTSPLQVHIPAGGSLPQTRGIPVTSRGSPQTGGSPQHCTSSMLNGSFHFLPAHPTNNMSLTAEQTYLRNMVTNAGLLASFPVSELSERSDWSAHRDSSPVHMATGGQGMVKQEPVWRPW